MLLSTRFCAERLLRGRSVSSRDNFIIQLLLLQICSSVDRPLRGRCHRGWLSSNAPFNAQCCVSTLLRTGNSPGSTPRDSTYYIVDLQLRVLSCSFYRIHRLFTSRFHRDDFGEIKAIVFMLSRSTVWAILLLSDYQRDVDNRGVALLVSRTTCSQSYQRSVSQYLRYMLQPAASFILQ